MGRKSRIKNERQELAKHGLSENFPQILALIDEHGKSIYRFFRNAEEADALAQGNVWLSTLKKCREYENPEQGDPEEAHETYNSGYAVGGSDDPRFMEISRRSGAIHFEPGCNVRLSGGIINDCTSRRSLPNAYVLCTTIDFLPENLSYTFGKYCVEITDPRQFFISVSESLERRAPISKAAAGKIIYKDRHYAGMESPPGPIGFVKPPDPYASQKEFRFLWIPKGSSSLTPFLLGCPKVKDLCKRIA